ncbi:hypothetical protein HOS58_gp47 [Streptomyces phage Attoomi]|uniref:Uncharacterized protein n=1 Tax=Streptomyces phage Attoomi TaxID=2059881 RepID=A0A2H5BLH0_9CAUD|nr:hypothetical protein HOS58_gp47 [Streptomyces phage Attoomi]AUG87179.1 hypothetical protein SEA_ATTOOMI_47 [Streptomyces phage Attoomi]
MTAPTWYHDGQLSLARGRMQDAHGTLRQVEGDAPPGPVTPEVTAAREAAYLAELAFVERFAELKAANGRA